MALALTLTALSSCGASSSPSGESVPGAGTSAKAAKGGVALKSIGSFDTPVFVTGAPGLPRLLFVVEQGGEIEVLRGGKRAKKPFLDISGLVSFEGERGLLSAAFPPDYGTSGRFYVYYTDREGDIRIDEFRRRSETRAAAGSRRAVIEIPHQANSNHNGGQAAFLGDLLYFGTGDGGSGGDPPNNAQNKESLLGKLIRIDPRPSGGNPYSVPPPTLSSAGPAAMRSTATGCATHSASHSTESARSSRGSRSATSARIASRSSTTRPSAAPRGPTSAGMPSRGSLPTRTPTAARRTPAAPSSRSSPTAAAAAARSSAATWSATAASRGLYKRYVYADLCEGQAAQPGSRTLAGPPATARSGSRSNRRAPSAKTAAATSTSSRWKARSTASFPARSYSWLTSQRA